MIKYISLLLLTLTVTKLFAQSYIIGNVYYLNSKFETGARVPAVGILINADYALQNNEIKALENLKKLYNMAITIYNFLFV